MDEDEVVKEIRSSDLLGLFPLIPKIIVWGSREIWARCTGGYRIYEDGSTSLHWAARDGKLNTVNYFIKNKEKKKIDINKADKAGKTALHVAIDRRHVEVVRALIAAGADLNTVNKYGFTPLHSALPDNLNENAEQLKCAMELVEALIAAGVVHKANRYGETPLHKAARDSDLERTTGRREIDRHLALIIAIVKGKVDVNIATKIVPPFSLCEETALYWTAKHGHIEVLKVLIAAGADVNKPCYKEAPSNLWFDEGDMVDGTKTPLQAAVRNVHLEVTKELIANGAVVQAYGEDVLNFAIYEQSCTWRRTHDYHDIMKLLIPPALLENPERVMNGYIRTNNDLFTIWNAVLEEITRMQNEKISGRGCSLYDFLKMNLDELANIISQKNFNLFKAFSFVEMCPHFSDLLQNKLEKLKPLIKERAKYLDVSDRLSMIAKDSGSKVVLNALPLRKVFGFLSNKTIESVVAASLPIRPSTFFKSPDETQGEHAQDSCNTESRRALRRCGF